MNRAKELTELVNTLDQTDRFGSRVGAIETFTPADVDATVQKLIDGIQAPFKNIYKSTLGGKERPAILIGVSLDPKESWKNSIYQNSRYFQMHYSMNGELEQFSRQYNLPKFRKARVKNADDAITKINAYIKSVEGSHEG